MSETLYVQLRKNIQVNKRDIYLSDVADFYCTDKSIVARVKAEKLLSIPDVKKRRICFSVMKVVEIVNNIYPNVEVNNMGETDFIVDYIKQKKRNVIIEYLLIAFVALLTFTGSAYGIMAYNNDVSTNEIFEKVYELFGTGDIKEYKLIEIMYAIGLGSGTIIFYNHFTKKKLTNDPTPIQVEMDKYEKDIDDALIDRNANSNAKHGG